MGKLIAKAQWIKASGKWSRRTDKFDVDISSESAEWCAKPHQRIARRKRQTYRRPRPLPAQFRSPFKFSPQTTPRAAAGREAVKSVQAWMEWYRALSATRQKFEKLADQWESETRNIASPKRIVSHPALRQIIDLGDDVVSMILRRMSHHPWFWFGALKELTKETTDPVKPSMRGDMQKMTEAWLRWGASHGKR